MNSRSRKSRSGVPVSGTLCRNAATHVPAAFRDDIPRTTEKAAKRRFYFGRDRLRNMDQDNEAQRWYRGRLVDAAPFAKTLDHGLQKGDASWSESGIPPRQKRSVE